MSFLFVSSLLYLGRVSHLNPELADLASLASQLALRIPCLCLPSDMVGDRLPCLSAIYVVLGIRTPVSMIVQQALY